MVQYIASRFLIQQFNQKALNYCKIDGLSLSTNYIESKTIFIKTTSFQQPIIVGVVYRRPNASLEQLNEAYEAILSTLIITKALGDFNINLLKTPSTVEDKFQEIVFNSGFVPIISISTHQMPV